MSAPVQALPAPIEARAQLKQVIAELQRRQVPAGLHPKQRTAITSPATELLYGGAAAGGKSHLLRVAAIFWCLLVPGIQVYIFRREFPDLYKNHMEGPGAFPVLLADLILRGLARIAYGKNQIRFANGSVIHLCHCQYEKDVQGYLGAEIHILMIDELTQWTRKMYTFLRARVRLGGLKIPAWLKGQLPRVLNGTNPGGIGHNWVKADFVSIAPELALTEMPKKEGGMLRQYVPALLEDNPTMLENDPDYEAKLEGIGDPALVRAMRRGDWDIVSGGMFDDVWDAKVHVVKPFQIPDSWWIDRAFDWGSSKPFSVGWWAESDGTALPGQRHYPRGTLFRIAEWYGWNGQPNEGSKMLAVEIADGIKAREQAAGWQVASGPADSSIFDVENGNCIADDMEKRGIYWERADKSPGSRKNGWEKLRQLLKASLTAPQEEPGLYVFNTCVHFIRTVPVLTRDPIKTDDIDTKAEEHVADETRYRVTAPRREWRQTHVGM